MSLRSAIPCQCTVVASGRWLASVNATVSPAVTRTSRPGSNPSYVHDLKVRPAPNSTGDAVALKVCLRSGSAGA
ncbi:hypothetical protein GCM10010261_64080 [Streptomyces pilosus]|nr:hypothetical protein GCM10010261_64080 [Streptomyces pilosus]